MRRFQRGMHFFPIVKILFASSFKPKIRLFGYPLFQGSRLTEIASSNRRIIDLDISELIEKEIRSSRNKQGELLIFKSIIFSNLKKA